MVLFLWWDCSLLTSAGRLRGCWARVKEGMCCWSCLICCLCQAPCMTRWWWWHLARDHKASHQVSGDVSYTLSVTSSSILTLSWHDDSVPTTGVNKAHSHNSRHLSNLSLICWGCYVRLRIIDLPDLSEKCEFGLRFVSNVAVSSGNVQGSKRPEQVMRLISRTKYCERRMRLPHEVHQACGRLLCIRITTDLSSD